MNTIFLILGILAAVGGLICWFVILIDAFKDSVLKGLIGLLCGLYLLFYALFDFEHENKWLIVIGAFGGSAIASGLLSLAR